MNLLSSIYYVEFYMENDAMSARFSRGQFHSLKLIHSIKILTRGYQ